MNIYQTLQKELSGKVVENEPLANHTTFKIGGPARYFFVAKIKEDAVKVIKVAKELGLPTFILGKGSNLLVSDEGFDGLVIKLQVTSYKLQSDRVIAGAGLELAKLVRETAKTGLTGLEFAAGIPGIVGAAVYGNVGAFGNSIADVLVSAEILDKNDEIKKVDNKWFQFSYRNSRLKKSKEIVLEAEFKLQPGSKEEIKNLINQHLAFRREKHPLDYPNAGSVFKNVEVSNLRQSAANNANKFANIRDKLANIREGKIPAGYLIDQCRLKGKQVGGVQVSEKHANFIVNTGGARASEVIKLINLIKKKVYDRFGIGLKEEIQMMGF